MDEDPKARAQATYNAASDLYDDPAVVGFWDSFAKRTLRRLDLQPGERVLDVCCGAGPSALAAAELVAPNGSVLGIDLADRLLQLARDKADARGLANVEFHQGDMEALALADASFQAVVCILGLFFVPDMSGAAAGLWRLVAPGGRLAVTTIGTGPLEPAAGSFWDAVRQVRPELYQDFAPWERVNDPEALREVLTQAGVQGIEVEAEAGEHVLGQPDDWWKVVLGTGFRGTVERLAPDERQRVRQLSVGWVRDHGVRSLRADAVIAVARRQ